MTAAIVSSDFLTLGRTRREDLSGGEVCTREVTVPVVGNVLVTGEQGSGKTVFARTILSELVTRENTASYVLTDAPDGFGSLGDGVRAFATTGEEQRAVLGLLLAKARRRFDRYSAFAPNDDPDIYVVIDRVYSGDGTTQLIRDLFVEGRLVCIYTILCSRLPVITESDMSGMDTQIFLRQGLDAALACFPSHYDSKRIEVVSELPVGEALVVENYGAVTRFRVTPTSTVRLENVLTQNSYPRVVGTLAGV